MIRVYTVRGVTEYPHATDFGVKSDGALQLWHQDSEGRRRTVAVYERTRYTLCERSESARPGTIPDEP